MDKSGSYYGAEGISQQGRFPIALNPDYFQIDERTVEDLLLFVAELSFTFNYFNTANKEDGNWSDFFLSDTNLLLRIFPCFDFKKYSLEYYQQRKQIDFAGNEEEYKAAFIFIPGIAKDFLEVQTDMFTKFNASATARDENKFSKFNNIVNEIINSIFTDKEYDKPIKKFEELCKRIASADGKDIRYEEVDDGLNKCDDLFLHFEIFHNRLVKEVADISQKQKPGTETYKPHVSLLIAFLELYMLVKKDLNQYTRKHLEFYYTKVLGFEPKKAVAEKVSMVLELNKELNEFLLTAGEKLVATIPGQAKKEIFTLTEDILVNRTEIAELKTIYKHTYYNFLDKGEKFEPIKEYRIYAADHPVLKPADFVNNRYPHKAWALFGEDQRDISSSNQSMKEANMGLMLASPLLYAADGKRHFSIKFYLDPNLSAAFYKLAVDYENNTRISKRVIIVEMLKKAFAISITGAEQWLVIPEYSTNCPANNGPDPFIEINFELGIDDPPIAVYRPDIHGTDFESKFPMVKLMLNTESFQHSYNFLFEQVVMRITIKVKVEGSALLKLQNNFGPLSASTPFQVFGPLPAVGSYLDIKNTNIFNRFTTDFKIKLNWFDLPKTKDGFNDYYEGYNDNVTNGSFKVGLSEVSADGYKKNEQQNIFALFQESRQPASTQALRDTTTFRLTGLENIHFENEPLLAGEEAAPMDNKGTIRIELIEPANAFYHKVYPVIFPEILLHNSKRKAKKLSLPALPFTPMVRSLVVDYALQHSEAVSGKNDDDVDPEIEIWHIYPFGFKKSYPQKKTENINLIPSIALQSNLYIGLKNVVSAKALTLLFQMEESVSFELDAQTKPMLWSYLYRNEWVNIDSSEILEDNTIDFKGTGIVKIALPQNNLSGNTLLNPNLYWIRISNDECLGSRIKAIFTQVVTAQRELGPAEKNENSLLRNAGMITEFLRKVPEISNIYQPFSPYHGKAAETNAQFYTWVSERLNHKQRLITSDDISRNILELFPEIHKVLCYTDTQNSATGDIGEDIQVVVIPATRNLGNHAVTDPKVNIYTLYKIRNYLYKNTSPFITVRVRNAEYERLKVFCSVIFKDIYKDRSNGILAQGLNMDIRKFISPWLFMEAAEVNENYGIYPSEILNFIKKLPYIDFVTGFSVVHFYYHYSPQKDQKQARVLKSTQATTNTRLVLRGSKPGAIIISAENHAINVIAKKINKTGLSIEDEVKPFEAGIGSLSIGNEFLVMNPYDVAEYPGVNVAPEKGGEEEIDFYYNANA